MSDKGLVTKTFLETAQDGTPALTALKALTGEGESEELSFTFEYGGFLFAVKALTDQRTTQIRLHANLGSMPYTAENAEARGAAMAVLRSASQALGGRVRLTPRQRILLQEELELDEPLTPVTLMSRTAKLLVLAKPYLELLTPYVHPPANA
jgi:hypothetical protein